MNGPGRLHSNRATAMAVVAMLLVAIVAPLSPTSARAADDAPFIADFPHDEGVAPDSLFVRIVKFPYNRFLDFLDVIGANIGFGWGLHVNVHATRLFQLGLGATSTTKFGNAGWPRGYGIFQDARGEFSIATASFERFGQTAIGPGSVDNYDSDTDPDRLYKIKRRYWAVGMDFTGLIVSIGLEMRPVEIFDFMAGLFGFDPMRDDL